MPEVASGNEIQPEGSSTSGGSGSAADRFASEKTWKEKEEALARISYAKGESDYEQYTAKMSQIQIDFNQKLLDRDDLLGTERLKIEADYWEAVNKDTQAQHARFVAIENESFEETVRNLNEQYAKKFEAGNMSAEQRQAAEKAHQEALELAELEHLRRLTVLQSKVPMNVTRPSNSILTPGLRPHSVTSRNTSGPRRSMRKTRLDQG